MEIEAPIPFEKRTSLKLPLDSPSVKEGVSSPNLVILLALNIAKN
jgi:hypothetical protein